MSYEFDASGEKLTATLGTALSYPFTMACYIWFENHPYPTGKAALSFGNSTSSINSSFTIRSSTATDNVWTCRAYDASGGNEACVASAVSSDGVWLPVVFFARSTTFRRVYVQNISNSDDATTEKLINTLSKVNLGEAVTGADDFYGGVTLYNKVAEVAIWDKELSGGAGGEIDLYMTGTAASGIGASNLRAYWSLATDASKTAGNDSVGDLTVSGATWSSAHPTVGPSLTKYLKLLTKSTAASATGVEGWVIDADDTTYYGHFTGAAFEADLESGEAVLKVAVSEFGGTALTTSDTPQVVVKNTTLGTSMCDATVIEE